MKINGHSSLCFVIQCLDGYTSLFAHTSYKSSTQKMQLYTNIIYKKITILLKYMNKMNSDMGENYSVHKTYNKEQMSVLIIIIIIITYFSIALIFSSIRTCSARFLLTTPQ